MVNVGDRVRVKYARRVWWAEVIDLARSGAVVVRFGSGSPLDGREVAVSVGSIRK